MRYFNPVFHARLHERLPGLAQVYARGFAPTASDEDRAESERVEREIRKAMQDPD